MALTLGNPLARSSSSIIRSANKQINQTGDSMSTGIKQNNSAVENYLGKGLQDNKLVLTAISQNMNYGVNFLDVSSQTQDTIAGFVQDGLSGIVSAGSLTGPKLAVLQDQIDKAREQVEFYIKTTKFDGRAVFDSSGSRLDVKTGTGSADKIVIASKDITGGKLFRSSVTEALNNHILNNQAGNGNLCTYYTTKDQVEADLAQNKNVFQCAVTGAGGSGTGGAMTALQFGTMLNAVIAAKPELADYLNEAAPQALAAIKAGGNNAAGNAVAGNTRDFSNATANDFDQLFTSHVNAKAELVALFSDDVKTTVAGPAQLAEACAIFQRALDTIRAEQASLSNQKTNVVKASDAVGASADIIGQVADSYLKTDYVEAAQTFSELIKQMQSAIAAMQANKQVSEAALSLVQGLAR